MRKPGAFARYRFREQLYPTHTFRLAYDAMCGWKGERADVDPNCPDTAPGRETMEWRFLCYSIDYGGAAAACTSPPSGELREVWACYAAYGRCAAPACAERISGSSCASSGYELAAERRQRCGTRRRPADPCGGAGAGGRGQADPESGQAEEASKLPAGKTWDTFEHERAPVRLRQQLVRLEKETSWPWRELLAFGLQRHRQDARHVRHRAQAGAVRTSVLPRTAG